MKYYYCGDYCSPETSVDYLMQKFLAKWRPDDYLTINWACTCSKPRVGEFGGGATFVTATEIEYINSGTWLYEKMLAFDGVKKEKKALQAEVKCERCSKVITGDEASPAPNPCEADLHDDYTNVIMCDDCRNEVSDDI